jgi:NAD+ diphosphatase
VPAPTTFAGGTLDRAADRRADPAWVRARVADPSSRAVVAAPDGVLVVDGDPPRPALVALADGAEGGGPADAAAPAPLAPDGGAPGPVLLGLRGGRALFAVEGGDGPAPAGARLAGLREVAARLPGPDAALLAYASALLHWHRRTRFCGVCGAPTEVAEAGHLRTCPRCGAHHHPRTDPVVIVLVTDGDRALLGRQARWPPGRYSALAGFVEPGESLEEAVAREVREEAGVEVAEPAYRASQPWPFPLSLMLGFEARAAGGEPAPRDGELEDVRWLTRAELAGAAEGRGPVQLPPPEAIARRLVDGWLARPTTMRRPWPTR